MIYFRCDEKINISKATKYSFQIIGLKPTDSSTYASCVQGLPTVTFELPCSYVTPKVQVQFCHFFSPVCVNNIGVVDNGCGLFNSMYKVSYNSRLSKPCQKMSEFKGHALKRIVKLGNLCTQYANIVRPRADLI